MTLTSPEITPTLLMPFFIINWPKTFSETVANSRINCFMPIYP